MRKSVNIIIVKIVVIGNKAAALDARVYCFAATMIKITIGFIHRLSSCQLKFYDESQ